ncbi:RluA family pseudouridine synthase [Sandaracinus amylolyticus]|uniref:Pseudouridine synthase n=1 Tax=Sandaracinus amylolyticus TaxID=927083 RepID=A0A0F6SHZ4_9BACT|nr:RluA family pseudouridine synthase [Sandaracinus amylolyticus]AKF11299.1 Ribosomal large subunit pseudouridine synthase D [Sandaracinus amylolyticus]
MIELEVEAAEAGLRLDVVLVRRVPGMSRAKAREMVESGAIRVNGRSPRKGLRLAPGDHVVLARAPAPSDFHARPDAKLPLHVVHEDPWLVVVDKPAGVPSHPLRENEIGTIASALVARYPEMSGVGYRLREPGILHRLDTDTSGLIVAARDELTFEALRTALKDGRIDKRYVALVEGRVDAPQVIDLPIGPHPRDPRRVVTIDVKGARPARTEILKAEAIGVYTRVEVSASHATRHQVRAHLAAIGHPLVGDALYGGSALPGLARHFLHASRIAFEHPHDARAMRFTSPLPRDLQAAIETAR